MPRSRGRIGGQYQTRTIDMLESPAHRVLSLSAHMVLDRVQVELAHHGGQDNGRLPVTYDDFVHYGLHRHAIGPAIRECVALGFLEVTERGRASAGEFRSPNLFRLTFQKTLRRNKPIIDPTDEWRKIATVEDAQIIARTARLPVAQPSQRRRPKTTLQAVQ